MKIVNGEKFLSIGEVSKIIGRSALTIKNWYEWGEQNGDEKLPEVHTNLNDRGTRFFKESDIPMLEEFRDSLKYGDMSDVNVKKWGKRGEDILQRRKEKDNLATN